MPTSKELLICLELSLICAMCQRCLIFFQMWKTSLRCQNKPVRNDKKFKNIHNYYY